MRYTIRLRLTDTSEVIDSVGSGASLEDAMTAYETYLFRTGQRNFEVDRDATRKLHQTP